MASSVERAAGSTDAFAVPLLSIWCELRHLEAVYPGFKHWYWGKVVPGVALGSRRIFTSTYNGRISGIVIAKRESEKKICTVWVPSEFRGRAIARELMESAITWVGTPRPLFTVPDGRMCEFYKLVDFFDFEHRETVTDFYGSGRIEHVFNGALTPPVHA
ncbi:GNAT family N-acetyltransferase [Gemmobacter caeruleus]|uniref:GNAT family N-acetyltransferase n=1 Tax=Gemmobacter caeruleus TaxID=2595004 RepID=UPI001939E394|nr:GNAT family N-acetyltransferase [Gemmobacter caeruleus]